MEAASRLQKFTQMLMHAQNQALVKMVVDNIEIEVTQDPKLILRILSFLDQDFAQSKSEFTRVKATEIFLPSLYKLCLKFDGQIKEYVLESLKELVSAGDSQKVLEFLKKVNIYCLADVDQKDSLLGLSRSIANMTFNYNDVVN